MKNLGLKDQTLSNSFYSLLISIGFIITLTTAIQASAKSNVIACMKGLGDFNKNGQFEVEKTFKDYQLFVSTGGALLKIGADLEIPLYPVQGNPFLSKDNKKFYRFFSNPPPFDTSLWEVRYFIDEQIAKAYTTDRKGNNPFRVGTALCPVQATFH